MTGQPFSVRHRTVGFLVVALVPLSWVPIFYGIRRLRRACLLFLALAASSVLANGLLYAFVNISVSPTDMLGVFSTLDAVSIALAVVISAAFFAAQLWLMWRYYNRWTDAYAVRNRTGF